MRPSIGANDVQGVDHVAHAGRRQNDVLRDSALPLSGYDAAKRDHTAGDRELGGLPNRVGQRVQCRLGVSGDRIVRKLARRDDTHFIDDVAARGMRTGDGNPSGETAPRGYPVTDNTSSSLAVVRRDWSRYLRRAGQET